MAASPLLQFAAIAQRQHQENNLADAATYRMPLDSPNAIMAAGFRGRLRPSRQIHSTPSGLNQSRSVSKERSGRSNVPAATSAASTSLPPPSNYSSYSSVGPSMGIHSSLSTSIRRPLQSLSNNTLRPTAEVSLKTRWSDRVTQQLDESIYPSYETNRGPPSQSQRAPSFRSEPYNIYHDPAAADRHFKRFERNNNLNESTDDLPAPHSAPPASPSARPRIVRPQTVAPPSSSVETTIHHQEASTPTISLAQPSTSTNMLANQIHALASIMTVRDARLLARLRTSTRRGRSTQPIQRKAKRDKRGVSAPPSLVALDRTAKLESSSLTRPAPLVPTVVYRECVSSQTEEPFIEPSVVEAIEAALVHVIGENHRLDAGMAVAEKGFEDRIAEMKDNLTKMHEVVGAACESLASAEHRLALQQTKSSTIDTSLRAMASASIQCNLLDTQPVSIGPIHETQPLMMVNVGTDATPGTRARGTMTEETAAPALPEVMQQHLQHLRAIIETHEHEMQSLKLIFSEKESLIISKHLTELEAEKSKHAASASRSQWAIEHAVMQRAKDHFEALACAAGGLTATCFYEKMNLQVQWAMGCAQLAAMFQEHYTVLVMDSMEAEHRRELAKIAASFEEQKCVKDKEYDTEINSLQTQQEEILKKHVEDLSIQHEEKIFEIQRTHENTMSQLKKDWESQVIASEMIARSSRSALDEANHNHKLEMLRLTSAHDRTIAEFERKIDRLMKSNHNPQADTPAREGSSLERIAQGAQGPNAEGRQISGNIYNTDSKKTNLNTEDASADQNLARWSASPLPTLYPHRREYSTTPTNRVGSFQGLLSPLSGSNPMPSVSPYPAVASPVGTPATTQAWNSEALSSPHLKDPFPSARRTRRLFKPDGESCEVSQVSQSPSLKMGSQRSEKVFPHNVSPAIVDVRKLPASPTSDASSAWSPSEEEDDTRRDSVSAPSSNQLSPSPPTHNQMRSLLAFLTR